MPTLKQFRQYPHPHICAKSCGCEGDTICPDRCDVCGASLSPKRKW